MNVFWRAEPLTEKEHKLLNLCLDAHSQSVHRDNISTAVLRNAAVGSLSFSTAIAAALCSIGGIHAPLLQSFYFLQRPMSEIEQHLELGHFVPGWGNSFEKQGIDPLWQPVADYIAQNFPELGQKIEGITLSLHNHGKQIYVNPSSLTAAVAIILDIPPEIVCWLFIQGRLSGWAQVFYGVVAGVNRPKGEI